MIAPALVHAAHAAAVEALRPLGLAVPSAIDVLAHLRRANPTVVACQASVRDLLDALSLNYADRDPPRREPTHAGWPLRWPT